MDRQVKQTSQNDYQQRAVHVKQVDQLKRAGVIGQVKQAILSWMTADEPNRKRKKEGLEQSAGEQEQRPLPSGTDDDKKCPAAEREAMKR